MTQANNFDLTDLPSHATDETAKPKRSRRKREGIKDALPASDVAATPVPSPFGETLATTTNDVTLVTGGTGFLGRHLLNVLRDASVPNVRVLTTSAPTWLREMNLEIVEGSITDREVLARACASVQDVYHLAGFVSRDGERDAHKMHTLHVEGTRMLCEAASQASVKNMVLASSSGTLAASTSGDFIADEQVAPPLEIFARWGYYASKFYQERTARETFKGERLVIMNPSLLLGTGDERLSSTKVVLDFLARKLPFTPNGGLNFVDARDAATAFHRAMQVGKHNENYLLGSVNWTFEKFFGRLERVSKVAAPRLQLPRKINIFGAKTVDAFFKSRNWTSPLSPEEVEQAEHFWYFTSAKAERELGFAPRDPNETLSDTVKYVREHFLGKAAAFGAN